MESKDNLHSKFNGDLVRMKRKELGLTQTDIAIKLGITKEGVSKLERKGAASNAIRIILNQVLGINLPMKIKKTKPHISKVESFRSRVIEELEGMKKNEEYGLPEFDGMTLSEFIERIKKM